MRISVLGAAGNIGQALSLLLKIYLPAGSELYLYDIKPVVLGITLDLSHIPNDVQVKGFTEKDIFLALNNTDIVIIAAGIARKPGMERADLFDINSNIIINLVEKIAVMSPNALVCIITNPINITTVIAAEVLKKYGCYNKNKLFGITTLDIMRANQLVFIEKNLRNIDVPVVGGHSEITILPLLSQLKNITFTDKEAIEITKSIQNAGSEVVKAKIGNGSATLSMGYAATRFCLSLVQGMQGKHNILEYAYIEGDGKYTRFFSQPFFLGRHGIEKYKDIGKINGFEQIILHKMIEHLNKDILKGEKFIKK
ncbi:malate dehydrogenase [Candidatus Pantoea edessiphila]|uniref:Malate dehydrogenase n=1 Tax=Candidatus Pantoea edessiphila TaxID=2044610 RepID=A0A2P5SVU2_9GAMM|nr:malate dehydrogenase [Candidatus Pantoea edessiphila]PPI86436.1 malate dehydrogenase [Candidatus Pantoea edessiphila]